MISAIRNHSKIIIIIVCVAMVATGALMFGGGALTQQPGNVVQSANVAVVNGANINQEHYYSVLRNRTHGMGNIPRSQEVPLKVDVLNSIIDRELILQEADNLSIEAQVTEEDIDNYINEILESNQITETELISYLEMNQGSLSQFRSELKMGLEDQSIIEQVAEYTYRDIVVSEDELINAYERVHPQVIVQKFDEDKSISEEKINQIMLQLEDGEDFIGLAEEFSDMARVDLGHIARDNNILASDITDKLFALESGLSDILEGEDAYYIFNILDKRLASGEEYLDKKETLENDILEEKQNRAFGIWMDNLRVNSNIEINDPVLSGYKALESGNVILAISELERALERNPVAMNYVYLAEAYRIAGQVEEARETFEKAIEKYSYDWEIHYQYGVLLIELEDNEKAISLIDQAAELAGEDLMVQYQLYIAYAQLGAEDKAEAQIEKINEIQRQMEAEEAAFEDSMNPNTDTEIYEGFEVEDSENLETETE